MSEVIYFVKWMVREVSLVRIALEIAWKGVSSDPQNGEQNRKGRGFMINLRGWYA